MKLTWVSLNSSIFLLITAFKVMSKIEIHINELGGAVIWGYMH